MSHPGNKICFITGGSGRLGKALAISLAENGYSVFFTYRSSEKEAGEVLRSVRSHSPESHMARCDVSKVDDIRSAFRTFRDHFGRLDLLVTSASNFFSTTLPEVSESEWDSLVDTNLKGTFFTMQAGASIMKEQPFVSRIITMSDISANLVWRNFAPYTASKQAIQHLTRVFAKVFAPKILVNSIAPGTVTINPEWNREPDYELARDIPLQRIGTPEDIIDTILFLARSDYITGQVVTVDGGRLLN